MTPHREPTVLEQLASPANWAQLAWAMLPALFALIAGGWAGAAAGGPGAIAGAVGLFIAWVLTMGAAKAVSIWLAIAVLGWQGLRHLRGRPHDAASDRRAQRLFTLALFATATVVLVPCAVLTALIASLVGEGGFVAAAWRLLAVVAVLVLVAPRSLRAAGMAP